ncbi:MAG: glutaredoxin [Actinomycetota bacterium]
MTVNPPVVTVVHAPGCHFCEDAERVLADLADQNPLDVRLVPSTSVTGLRLVAAHRPALFPLVLVDGAFFSAGRLPHRRLRTVLAARAGVPAAVVG